MRFSEFYESAPPGMEKWIKDRKADFKKRYGDRWEEVLYATAWKQKNKNESVELTKLDEINRRGFLKGLGAVGVAGALGSHANNAVAQDASELATYAAKLAVKSIKDSLPGIGPFKLATDDSQGGAANHVYVNIHDMILKYCMVTDSYDVKNTINYANQLSLKEADFGSAYGGITYKINIFVSTYKGALLTKYEQYARGDKNSNNYGSNIEQSTGQEVKLNLKLNRQVGDIITVHGGPADGKKVKVTKIIGPSQDGTVNKGLGVVVESVVSEKMHDDHKKAIKGMHQLSGDQFYGIYKFGTTVAGHDGEKQTGKDTDDEISDKPFAYAYTDAEEKMIKAADPGAKKVTSSKSEEADDVNESRKFKKKSIK